MAMEPSRTKRRQDRVQWVLPPLYQVFEYDLEAIPERPREAPDFPSASVSAESVKGEVPLEIDLSDFSAIVHLCSDEDDELDESC